MGKTTPLGTLEIVGFPTQPGAELQTVSVEARRCFQEGLTHFQSGDAVEAVAAFSRSIEYAPSFTEGHLLLGIAHALTSNIYPAIDHLEEAVKLDPDSFGAQFTLAQLNFKLRIPENGYVAARNALRCVQTLEQRKALTQLLKEERGRERNGIARPSFAKAFSGPMLFLGGGAVAALIIFAIALMR